MTTYISDNFKVTGWKEGNQIFLTQQVIHPKHHTSSLPGTICMLEKNLPSIFTNKCFNPKNNTFKQEAKNTQVGHLLEHMILENLKLLTEEKYGEAHFKGITKWNWKKEKTGKFNITISANCIEIDNNLFTIAFARSISLLEEIYSYSPKSGKNYSRSLSNSIN